MASDRPVLRGIIAVGTGNVHTPWLSITSSPPHQETWYQLPARDALDHSGVVKGLGTVLHCHSYHVAESRHIISSHSGLWGSLSIGFSLLELRPLGLRRAGSTWLAADQQQFAFFFARWFWEWQLLGRHRLVDLDHLGHTRHRLYLFLGVSSCGSSFAFGGLINTDLLQMHFASLYRFIAATFGTL